MVPGLRHTVSHTRDRSTAPCQCHLLPSARWASMKLRHRHTAPATRGDSAGIGGWGHRSAWEGSAPGGCTSPAWQALQEGRQLLRAPRSGWQTRGSAAGARTRRFCTGATGSALPQSWPPLARHSSAGRHQPTTGCPARGVRGAPQPLSYNPLRENHEVFLRHYRHAKPLFPITHCLYIPYLVTIAKIFASRLRHTWPCASQYASHAIVCVTVASHPTSFLNNGL